MEDKIIIKIKCPHCGAVIKIEVSPSLDMTKGKLTCPACKAKSSLADYRVISNDPVPNEVSGIAYPLREDKNEN